MRTQSWRILMLFTLTLVLVAGALDAQAARRSSLAGNQFIDDPDDMFAFPQLALQYKNRIIVDMEPYTDTDGNVGSFGNGSIVFGNDSAWNFNTGRKDFINNAAFWAMGGSDRYWSGFAMNGFPGFRGGIFDADMQVLEWWDLGYAVRLGETPFGVNFSWAKDSAKVGAPGGVDYSTNLYSLQLGATLGTVDLAGEFGIGGYSNNAAPNDQQDVDYLNFSLIARGDLEDVGGLDWRWAAAFVNGTTKPKADGADNLTSTVGRASFGPVWGTAGEWEVASYMSFLYSTDDFSSTSSMDFVIFPSYNIAMEYYVTSWLVARTGVVSYNGSVTEKYQGTDENGNVADYEDKYRLSSFSWTLGFGVDKGSWGVDLALNEADVHSGYLPLNGSVSDTPISYLTAWLAW
jgi:hypothetical protein